MKGTAMDAQIANRLKFLGLKYLEGAWEDICDSAHKQKMSYHRFLSGIIEKEYHLKAERGHLARLKAAKIPEPFQIETFPFARQPKLKKKMLMELYDSLSYIKNNSAIIFMGPTGVGKTGLATALLTHAINNGYRGRYITFNELIELLLQSGGDFTRRHVINRLVKMDCLFIDDFAMGELSPHFREQSGYFFELMNKRHGRACTIISTQRGYDEWKNYFKEPHITAALIDRLTVDCILFDMKNCKGLRPRKIINGIEK